MPNVDLTGPVEISSFRQMATVVWDHPYDPSIYGYLDFDAEPVERRLAALREQGVRVTVTHLVARALGLVLARHPDLNVMLRRRRLYQRKNVDVFLQVAMPDPKGLGKTDLSGVKIVEADKKDVVAIAKEVEERIELVRRREDPELQKSKNRIAAIPRMFLKGIVRFFGWCQREPNWRMKWAGMPKDPFGSIMVTSLGMMGVETAFAPLFPIGGPPMIILVGAIKLMPVALPDGTIVARRTLRLCGTFDHRVVDGFHLAQFSKELKNLLEVEAEVL
ncbi:MAG: 2-oxo acid dehydrogenase subunit E2 [Deltaproteobacteria bacterium]|nr:2-oxo acid dehydrogenase subunit E2 [Deltaproteobacteria bacterium]